MNKLKIPLLFLLLLAWFQAQSQSIDTLVNVGTHKLHFKIIKGNNHPILFESGNGDDGSTWEPLLKSIHDSTGATIITYDRAGLGKSEIDTTAVSFAQEVKDLNYALNQLGYSKDFFIVAHSFGGMYASEFAYINKGKVKGAVFIDVSTPCELTTEYTTRVHNSISIENWEMLNQHVPGLYYVLSQFTEIAQYMSQRYISNAIPLTLIVADHYKPTQQIGETEQDMINRRKCLKDFGNIPNHNYVTTKNTDHKVWEKDPMTVVSEIVSLYNQTYND